jgi:hypothetical protein
MSGKITVIYRRPEHAGKAPITKSVQHGETVMRTLDPKRLAKAGAVSMPVRRRGLSTRTAIFLLSLLGLLVLVAALVVSTSGKAHAQGVVCAETVCPPHFESSPPCLNCVYLPLVK